MSAPEHPQIYLITPPELDLSDITGTLAEMLDAQDIACVRMALSTVDADLLGRTADLLRDTCHARDVPLVVDSHAGLVATHGLDGVHLRDGHSGLRDLRKELGSDAIIGCDCGASRHAGMTAGEIGADYVSFSPVSQSPLDTRPPVEAELFTWWSEMIEVPVVAEGFVTPEAVMSLRDATDFFALGPEIWSQSDPVAALEGYVSLIAGEA